MTEPADIERALEHVAPRWDAARTEHTLEGAQRKRVVRRRRLWIAGGGAALGVLAAGIGLAALSGGVPGSQPIAGAERSLVLADGSRALLLDADARVVVAEVGAKKVVVDLPAGRARFDVVPDPERSFHVRCGAVEVQVLGTSFELTRDGPRTYVRVLHGRVRVRWPAAATELGAGQSGWFPRPLPGALAAVPPAEAVDIEFATAPGSEPQRARTAAASRAARAQGWRQHAEEGDFGRAYALLDSERVADDVEELLLAADAARLSGHAAAAVPFLQKVVDSHAEDPRAPLAAFTLGGVLMNQLGRPREAEAAYARARSLSPHATLSQDALARQVEAAHRADDPARARALALEYLDSYPNGRRAQAVRRFGGLP